jgi:hypothetical protein
MAQNASAPGIINCLLVTLLSGRKKVLGRIKAGFCYSCLGSTVVCGCVSCGVEGWQALHQAIQKAEVESSKICRKTATFK